MNRGKALGRAVGRTGRGIVYRTPLVRSLASRLRPRACVLVYHRVAAVEVDPYGQAVHPQRFAQHLKALRRRYRVVALGELVRGLHDRDYPDGAVAITFDDGYADTLEEGYPAAAALEVPIHVFVTAGPVAAGEAAFWWDELATLAPHGERGYGVLHDELRRLDPAGREARLEALRDGGRRQADAAGRPLTAAELAELATLPLTDIGAHTVTHPALAMRPLAEQREELGGARTLLAELTGVTVDLLSYPFGKPVDVSSVTRRLAAEVGFEAAFTTVPRALVPTTDPYALPRLAVHDWPPEQLLGRLASIVGPVVA